MLMQLQAHIHGVKSRIAAYFVFVRRSPVCGFISRLLSCFSTRVADYPRMEDGV